MDSVRSAAQCTAMALAGFFPRTHLADNQDCQGFSAHYMSVGFCQGGPPVTKQYSLLRYILTQALCCRPLSRLYTFSYPQFAADPCPAPTFAVIHMWTHMCVSSFDKEGHAHNLIIQSDHPILMEITGSTTATRTGGLTPLPAEDMPHWYLL